MSTVVRHIDGRPFVVLKRRCRPRGRSNVRSVTVETSRPQRPWASSRLLLALTTVGAVTLFVSLTTRSWYSVAGPHVVGREGFDDGPARSYISLGSVDGFVVVDPDRGSQHSALTWILVVLCVAAAVAACLSSRVRLPLSIVGVSLAVVLMAGAAYRVVGSVIDIHTDDSFYPAGTHLVVEAGFWATEVGLALILAACVLALRDVLAAHTRRT
jgi:hypothetical protein